MRPASRAAITAATWLPPWMAGWATWGSGSPGEKGDVADGEDVRVSGKRQVAANRNSAASGKLDAEQPRHRAGGDACSPDDRAGRYSPPIFQNHGIGLDMVDTRAQLHRDLASPQRCRGLIRERPVEGAEHAVGRFDERDRRRRRGEIGVVLSEHLVDQLAKAAGHLHAGRPAADDHDAEIDGRRRVGAGSLEPAEQMGPKPQCIVQRLERKGVGADTVDAERRADRSGGDDEVVVAEHPVAADRHRLMLQIDVRDLTEHEADRVIAAEDPSNREADVVGIETSGSHLVEQRLEGVEVVGVDHRDVDLHMSQALGSTNPPEAGTDDDHVRATHRC